MDNSKPTIFRTMNNKCRQAGHGGKKPGEIKAARW